MPSILEISVFEHQTCQTILTSKIYPVVAHVQYQFVSFQKNHCEHPTIIKIVNCCSIAHNLMLSPAVISGFVWLTKDVTPTMKAFHSTASKSSTLTILLKGQYICCWSYSDISHLILCHAIIFCICSIAQRRHTYSKRQAFESAALKI